MAGKANKPKPQRPPPDDAEQSKRFEEAAREIGSDESGTSFQRAIDSVLNPVKIDENKKGTRRKGQEH